MGCWVNTKKSPTKHYSNCLCFLQHVNKHTTLTAQNDIYNLQPISGAVWHNRCHRTAKMPIGLKDIDLVLNSFFDAAWHYIYSTEIIILQTLFCVHEDHSLQFFKYEHRDIQIMSHTAKYYQGSCLFKFVYCSSRKKYTFISVIGTHAWNNIWPTSSRE